MAGSLKPSVSVAGVAEAQIALRAMVAAAEFDTRGRAVKIAQREARQIVNAAAGTSRQARMAARSVRVTTDEDGAAVVAGGSTVVRTGGAGGAVTGADVFYGTEFGGGSRPETRQFPPWRGGRRGYWFTPTLDADEDDVADEFAETLDVMAGVWAD